ncbi:MAG: hypothetical protein L0229_13475 [Blastocatellia bacterium]|nr:hypothetical protein [Blastocatellia bacterium]
MTYDKANVIAMMVMTLGIIFFIAMAFGVMPRNYALFAGVSCFIIATMVRRISVQKK